MAQKATSALGMKPLKQEKKCKLLKPEIRLIRGGARPTPYANSSGTLIDQASGSQTSSMMRSISFAVIGDPLGAL
jgi:hypothetical protein